MKWLIFRTIVLFVMGVTTLSADTSPSEMSDELRLMVLNLDPKDVGLTKDNFSHPVFALVMETGFPEGSYTLSSVADGSTSLYFSTRGIKLLINRGAALL